mmetsp:Transcript_41858/g.129360  ORF Transcript_41858/g.129360 Transcript_41858/m.129360 type:complete len:92 (+) Transcript_41858:568-843(+)
MCSAIAARKCDAQLRRCLTWFGMSCTDIRDRDTFARAEKGFWKCRNCLGYRPENPPHQRPDPFQTSPLNTVSPEALQAWQALDAPPTGAPR